ncbi:hypothetical protein [Catenulispora pinisilvae]|nr:hypothetical protein [Catenulispora pinisilvae]
MQRRRCSAAVGSARVVCPVGTGTALISQVPSWLTVVRQHRTWAP